MKSQNLDEDVEFRLNLADELPNELYGDSIKLKQILLSLLSNSIKYTEKGFIELRVSSIIKNDICRLLLTVEDSGKGIDIYKQNEIMDNHEDMSEEDIESLNSDEIPLKVIRKMVSAIGGTFTIDTNKYRGTTITIALDQRMVHNELSKEEESIEKYSDSFRNQKRCAIVSLNNDDIKNISSVYKKNGYKVDKFDGTKVLLDILRNKENYDVIYIDEYMEKIDARSFIMKCKDIEGFKAKVIVISKNNSINNKKELLNYGFSGTINSPVNKKDIKILEF